MKTVRAILVLLLAFWLAGCVLRGKQQTANTPPPPQPVVKPQPPPPREPLSISQTQVELPPPQPVSQEAAAAAQLPGEPAEPAVTTPPRGGTSGRRTPAGPPPVPPARSEPPAATPPPAVTAPPAAAQESPRIQEIVPPTEQKHLQELADSRRRESRQLVDQAAGHRLTRHQTSVRKTVESFLKASEEAEGKGDMRQAADLADRALTLAKDLLSGR